MRRRELAGLQLDAVGEAPSEEVGMKIELLVAVELVLLRFAQCGRSAVLGQRGRMNGDSAK